MADPKKAFEELQKKYQSSWNLGNSDPQETFERLKREYTASWAGIPTSGVALPERNAGYTLTAPSVSLSGVKNQGNLLSMNVGQEQKKRALIDEQIEALEEEKKLLNKEKDLWSNSQFKGPKWAEVDAQIQAIDRQIAQLDKSTWSQDVIDSAENEQKNRADAYEYTAETRRLLNMDTQMAEAYAGQLEKIKESQKQFEREYNQFMDVDPARSQAAKRNYDAVTDLIGQMESKVKWEDIDRAKNLQRQVQLNQVANQPGFSYMSGYKSTLTGQAPQESINKGGAIYKSTDGWGDLTYELVNKIPEAIDIERQNASVTGGKDVGSDKMYLLQMNDREVSIYNYYYRNDKKTADEYLELLKPELLERQANKYLANIQQMAKESPGAASVMSVGMGIASLPSAVGQVLDYLDDGKIEINSAYNNMPRAQKAIRETVGQQIEEKLGDKWGKVGSAGYQLGMSMADFLTAAGVSGGVGNLASVLLGGSAAAQTTIEAKQRGLSDGQAISLGVISGVAEWFTERFSIEKLLDVADMGKSAGSYILKNILAEGGEEGASNLINLAADVLISRDKSQWKQTVEAYKNAGYEEKSAFMMAFNDQVMQLGADVLGGGISGGLMGGGNVAINNASYALSRPSGAYQQRQEIMDAIMKMAEEESLGAEVQTQIPQVKPQTQQQSARRPDVQLPQANEVGQEENKIPAGVSQRAQMGGNTDVAEPAGDDLPDGGRGRLPGQSAGEQSGTVRQTRTVDQAGRANDRRNRAAALGLQKVSGKEDGIAKTTANKTYSYMPETAWDNEMREVYDEVYQKTGKKVQYIIGKIEIDKGNGIVGYARGVWTTDGRIIVQADNDFTDIRSIAMHESFHENQFTQAELEQIYDKITRGRSKEELEALVTGYWERLKSTIGRDNQGNELTMEEGRRALLDEVFADANANMNEFGAGQYQQTVQQEAARLRAEREAAAQKKVSQATQRTTGPPQQMVTQPKTSAETDARKTELEQVLEQMSEQLAAGNITEEEFDAVYDEIMSQPEMQDSMFSMDAEEKKSVIADLRTYLSGGMTAQQLNERIGQRGTQASQRAEKSNLSPEAAKIKNAARRQRVSVEEYLHRNWELFDVDGQWNEAAREALDDERGVRFSEETMDIDAGSAYNEENNEEERNDNEERAETRREFLERVHAGVYEVQERGNVGYAYRTVAWIQSSYSAETAGRELERLGIPCFFHDGIEINANGVTIIDKNTGVAINKDIVGIYKGIFADGIELAGHEASHVWMRSSASDHYLETLEAQTNYFAPETIALMDEVAKLYFKNSKQINMELLAEETIARISGLVHSGKEEARLRKILKDYDAVKKAWDDLVEQQIAMADFSFESQFADEYEYDEADEDVMFSEETDPEIEQMEAQLRNLMQDINTYDQLDRQWKQTEEYKRVMDGVRIKDQSTADFERALEEYKIWNEQTGYGENYNKLEEARIEERRLRNRIQRAKEEAAKRAREAYRAKYDDEMAKKYASKAARHFGTTSRFNLAGYLTTNGTLLDFSEGQGYRVQDHREVANVLDFLPEEHGYSDGLIEFMNLGNIRLQSYGIDISKAPNKQQIPVLRRFFNSLEGEVTVDFSDADGGTLDSIDYDMGTRADKILSDIDTFFKTGTLPRSSDTARFHSMFSEEADVEISRDTLNTKATNYLRGVETSLTRGIKNTLGVSRFQDREDLTEIVRQLSDEYLRTGTVQQESIDNLFEQAYQRGIVVDDEFYNENKDIKTYLRKQAISLSEYDQHDIPDWKDWRKAAFGLLNISKDGTPVNIAYEELRDMAPYLFPETITAPSDQIQRMRDVADSIRKVERNLDGYYGAQAQEFKRWAKADFETAIGEHMNELRAVRRYAQERAAQGADIEMPETVQDTLKLYERAKQLRRDRDKVRAKNLLTDSDEMQLGRLHKGEITLQMLPEGVNAQGIERVYLAEREYEQVARVINEYNRRRKAQLKQEADGFLETANEWKDKKTGLQYARETQERNIRDIVPDEALAQRIIDRYFTPVHEAQAKATAMKNEYRQKVKDMKLSRKVEKGNLVSEAHAVQLLGEAEDNIRVLENSRGRMKMRDGKTLAEWKAVVENLWTENPKLNEQKIRNAVEEFRKIYDALFQKMNETRVRNGYEPINYRQGYFPHFQPNDTDGILGAFSKALGIDMQTAALPTSINGLTHTFKPGIQWFGNAQERLGFNTAYDAMEGFDKYIEGVADVIFQTDNIQALRALAAQIRYRTTNDGIRGQVDKVMESDKGDADKQREINEIYERGKFALSNFVVDLEEYTNLLANKKSRADRNMEQALGRGMYQLIKALESRVAANMVAVNPGSWLTNFIPLTQGGAQLGHGNLLQGMWQTLKNYKDHDGFEGKSAFLTNRRGSDPLVKTWSQKASGVMSAPMEYIDNFVADSLVRARTIQNVKAGMSEDAAIREADAWAAGVMADRSKGSLPTLFNRTNPLTKVFTQFQLEVNNQFSYLFKDLPREQKKKGLLALTAALLKFFLGAWLYNEIYEYFIGRRPALDPIGMLNDTVGDLTGYELPNLLEAGVSLAQGEDVDFTTEKQNRYTALENLFVSAAEELPFIGGILGGGRVPIQSALPDFQNLAKAAVNEDWSAEKKWATVGKELLAPATYLLPPFGGGQAKKLLQGIKATVEGGRYTVDAQGNKKLQYPVYKEEAVTAAIFGPTATSTGREWIENDFPTLGINETAAYQALRELGLDEREAYELVTDVRAAEKTETMSEAEHARQVLRDAYADEEAKGLVYYSMLASDKEKELMDVLSESNEDLGSMYQMLDGIRLAENSNAKRQAIMDANLTDEEKRMAYQYMLGTKQDDGSYLSSREDDIDAFLAAGLKMDDFLKAQNEYTAVNEEFSGAGDKAVEFSWWLDKQNWTNQQKQTAKEAFKYYSQIPQTETKYDKFTGAGLNDRDAYNLNEVLSELQPEEGKDSVSARQKYKAIADEGLSDEDTMKAFSAVMTESEYKKVTAGFELALSPRQYANVKYTMPQFDENQNGSYSNAEVEAAIDAYAKQDSRLDNGDKAILWQMLTGNTSAKNNPYSRTLAERYLEELSKLKGEE